jgi:hypothetical protein
MRDLASCKQPLYTDDGTLSSSEPFTRNVAPYHPCPKLNHALLSSAELRCNITISASAGKVYKTWASNCKTISIMLSYVAIQYKC